MAQVQAPALDLPPIPEKLMQPCEEPSRLTAGTIAEMYQQMLADAGLWGKCVRDHDALIAIERYREEILAKWKDQAAKLAAQPRWKWWQ